MRPNASRAAAALLSLTAAMLLLSSLGAAPPQDSKAKDSATKPKHKDSNPRFQPKEVTFATHVSPGNAKPGDVVTYTVEVTIEEGWHIYGLAPAGAKPATTPMPEPTKFDFFGTAGLTLNGGWTSDPKPNSKLDPAFGNAKVTFHEGKVKFQQKLRIPKDAKPGKFSLRNQIYFQTCDEKKCLPPAYITLPDAEVNVGGNPTTLNEEDARAIAAAILVASTPSADPGTTSTPPRKVGGDLGKAIDGGLWTFLLYSALGGLVAVLMPCVWPMIPITVNFFVKQGEKSKSGTTGLAITYCAAIIGIFTGLGLGVTLLRGGSGASDLGNNAWMNLFMGIAFIALGASLLGLFEIRLPSSFLNFSSQGEGKGGLLGVMFMALTLTLTSFTCTAPVVGALLGEATRGRWFYPVLGMLTFSAVLALPFFLLALMPGLMKKMPRSGDWMNAVKVVGGLIEIGAAFKFLNTAEISFGTSPKDAWFNAAFVLTAWVVVALVCGVYLLGLFRTNHDHEAIQVGPARLMLGMGFLGIALFLMPALFGVRPPNKVFDAIVGILPADVDRMFHGPSRSSDAQGSMAVEAISKDPKVALLQEKKFHGVVWGLSYDAAVTEAKAANRPVLIDFTGVNCANCRTVEQTIMPRPDVVAELKKFVTVSLYNDFVDIASITLEQREELADENKLRALALVDTIATPVYVVVTPEGKLLGKVDYSATDPDFLVKFLREMQGKFQGSEKVAAK